MDTPSDIKARTAEHILCVTWPAGHESAYGFKYLRCHCGCASCVDEHTGIRTLDPASVPESISIADMSLVGNYAMKIQWSDGHDTGIYSWDYMLRLCPCEKCGGPKSYERRISPLRTRS